MMDRWFSMTAARGARKGAASSRHSPQCLLNTVPMGELNAAEQGVWRQLMLQWQTTGLRQRMAETLPDLIATLWTPDFLGLHEPATARKPRSLLTRLDPSELPLLLSSPSISTANNTQWWCRDLFHKFILHMYSHARISTTALVLGLLYVHQLRTNQAEIRGAVGSEYRLYLMGLVMANKFTEDHPYTNRCWGTIAGVRGDEVNRMEREFLLACGHDIYIQQACFQRWTIKLASVCDWLGWCRPAPPSLLDSPLMLASASDGDDSLGSGKNSWASPFLPSPDPRDRRER